MKTKRVTALWNQHQGVRSGKDLTVGERAADKMRNGMGSWWFVGSALLFLGMWMLYNGKHGFDPYPFILLNLLLSCLAAMQGAILLIAAKRSDQISSELATSDHKIDETTLATVTEIRELTVAMHQLTKDVHTLSQTIYDHISQTTPSVDD